MSFKAYNSDHESEVITYMSYDEWENLKNKINKRRLSKINEERKRKMMYFRRQRSIGIIVFLVGLICLLIGCNTGNLILQYFGGIIGIVGFYLVLTKRMMLVDNYFLELH